MFPERDIANAFWAFVRDLAIDPRVGTVDAPHPRNSDPERISSRTLDRVEKERFQTAIKLAGPRAFEKVEPAGSPTGIWRFPNHEKMPWGYRTLQEALTAFLIDSAARNRLWFDLGIWHCTVTLILADAIRDPDLLHVILRDVALLRDFGQELDDPEGQREYIMMISDDWSCLRAETFNHIVAAYTGKG